MPEIDIQRKIAPLHCRSDRSFEMYISSFLNSTVPTRKKHIILKVVIEMTILHLPLVRFFVFLNLNSMK